MDVPPLTTQKDSMEDMIVCSLDSLMNILKESDCFRKILVDQSLSDIRTKLSYVKRLVSRIEGTSEMSDVKAKLFNTLRSMYDTVIHIFELRRDQRQSTPLFTLVEPKEEDLEVSVLFASNHDHSYTQADPDTPKVEEKSESAIDWSPSTTVAPVVDTPSQWCSTSTTVTQATETVRSTVTHLIVPAVEGLPDSASLPVNPPPVYVTSKMKADAYSGMGSGAANATKELAQSGPHVSAAIAPPTRISEHHKVSNQNLRGFSAPLHRYIAPLRSYRLCLVCSTPPNDPIEVPSSALARALFLDSLDASVDVRARVASLGASASKAAACRVHLQYADDDQQWDASAKPPLVSSYEKPRSANAEIVVDLSGEIQSQKSRRKQKFIVQKS